MKWAWVTLLVWIYREKSARVNTFFREIWNKEVDLSSKSRGPALVLLQTANLYIFPWHGLADKT